MRILKRAGTWLLTAAMITQLLPAAGAAVSSDNAKSYLQAVQSKPQANSYLVDFDGDGADELVLAWQGEHNEQMEDKTAYEVWNASGKIASGESYEVSIAKSAQTLVLSLCDDGEWRDENTYQTLQNGKWVTLLSAQRQLQPTMRSDYTVDGKTVTEAEYLAAIAAYKKTQDISYAYGAHSVENQLVSAIDVTVDGYEDVLSTLSSIEKKALFEDFLYYVAGVGSAYEADLNVQTASDGELVFWLENLRMDTAFPISDSPFPQQDFTALTQRLFGRTIDYSKFAIDHEPTDMDVGYDSVYYNGTFYLCWPQRGSNVSLEELTGKPQYLYALGGKRYYAAFSLTTSWDSYACAAVVQKNSDGSWRLLHLYPANYTPTPAELAELAAFVAPSGWAKDEVAAADAAGLIPELTGAPAWQDNATRLQFAELAVRFAEKATGKTLAAAPSSTFSDTASEAVLKAYQAGIVNGTSDTAFSPNDSLTREQLATMLWRAIQYVQKETGKTALAAGGSLSGYTDAAHVSSWAKEAVSSLAQNGIMKGTSSTQLAPSESCSVEQSVLLVYRTYTKLQ